MLCYRKIYVRNRLLLIRIYLNFSMVRYVLDVCDLVRTRNRVGEYRQRYYASMIILKSYADLAIEYKQIGALFDFDFPNRKVDYTRKIQQIQKVVRIRVYRKRNKALIAYEQTLLYQRIFTFKGVLLLIQLIDRIQENRIIAYVCSLTATRNTKTYLNSYCQITTQLVEQTKTQKALQKMYEFDFNKKTLTLFILDLTKVIQIQNYILRKLTKSHFKSLYKLILIATEYRFSQKLLFYLYLDNTTLERTLYCESLTKQRKRRYKVIRHPLP